MTLQEFFKRAGANVLDAIRELREVKPSWLEIFFGCLALAGGVWSFFYPYVGEWFEMPEWVAAMIFCLAGLAQLGAFFWREIKVRQFAAGFGFCFWGAVAFVMFMNQIVGWMATVGPLIAVFQLAILCILEKHKDQIRTNAGQKRHSCG